MEIYPDLEGEEIHSMLMQIKQQNNGSFKNLTVKDITERVSELKGIYYFYIKYILANMPLLIY